MSSMSAPDRIFDCTERIVKLEAKIESLESRLLHYESHRDETKSMLAEIKKDTGDIVALYNGGGIVGKIFLWMVLVGAGLAGIATYFFKVK